MDGVVVAIQQLNHRLSPEKLVHNLLILRDIAHSDFLGMKPYKYEFCFVSKAVETDFFFFNTGNGSKLNSAVLSSGVISGIRK